MSYVTNITTNLKSPDGEKYSVDLGKNTILIGDNEAGKSGIVEAVELARTGSAFGLLYRDKPIKDGGLLSALIPAEADKGEATALLDNGQTCSWSLERGKRPEREGPNGVSLSISEIRPILCGSEETKSKFFARVMSGPHAISAIYNRVPEALHEMLALVLGRLEPGLEENNPEVFCLHFVDVYEEVCTLIRSKSTAAKTNRTTLGSLGSLRDVSADEVDGLWDSLERAFARDLLRALYMTNRASPGTHATNTIQEIVNQLGGKEAVSRIPPTEQVRETLEEVILQRRLVKVAGIARNNEASAEMRVGELKRLRVEILHAIQLDINVQNEGVEFKKRVSGYLPRGEKFILRFDGGNSTIGMERGGKIRTALSGSTEARLLAAIAAALADESKSLLVVDDRMWDAGTLGKMLGVLERAPCQVLVMTTVKPKGKKREDWTYIKVCRTLGQPLLTETA